jgi:hypothetical protein
VARKKTQNWTTKWMRLRLMGDNKNKKKTNSWALCVCPAARGNAGAARQGVRVRAFVRVQK